MNRCRGCGTGLFHVDDLRICPSCDEWLCPACYFEDEGECYLCQKAARRELLQGIGTWSRSQRVARLIRKASA